MRFASGRHQEEGNWRRAGGKSLGEWRRSLNGISRDIPCRPAYNVADDS